MFFQFRFPITQNPCSRFIREDFVMNVHLSAENYSLSLQMGDAHAIQSKSKLRERFYHLHYNVLIWDFQILLLGTTARKP